MTPGSAINKKTRYKQKHFLFHCPLSPAGNFSYFVIPSSSAFHTCYTDLLICSCGTFITPNITLECSSHRHHFPNKHNCGNGIMQWTNAYSPLWRAVAVACHLHGFELFFHSFYLCSKQCLLLSFPGNVWALCFLIAKHHVFVGFSRAKRWKVKTYSWGGAKHGTLHCWI